jgi:hypothetical protein
MRHQIHSSARKHGIADKDIRHAVNHAIAIDDQDDDLRLYVGPARNAALLEIGTVLSVRGREIVVHAMKMRPKYRSLVSGGAR